MMISGVSAITLHEYKNNDPPHGETLAFDNKNQVISHKFKPFYDLM